MCEDESGCCSFFGGGRMFRVFRVCQKRCPPRRCALCHPPLYFHNQPLHAPTGPGTPVNPSTHPSAYLCLSCRLARFNLRMSQLAACRASSCSSYPHGMTMVATVAAVAPTVAAAAASAAAAVPTLFWCARSRRAATLRLKRCICRRTLHRRWCRGERLQQRSHRQGGVRMCSFECGATALHRRLFCRQWISHR